MWDQARAVWSRRAAAASIASFSALVIACNDTPASLVRYTTTEGVTARTVADNHTYAWGANSLEPAIGPSGGKLEFLALAGGEFVHTPKQQELMAFDLSWHLGPGGFLQTQRPIFLDSHDAYNTIIGHGAIDLLKPPGYLLSFKVAHIARYWHGSCAIRLNWTDGQLGLFPLLNTALANAVACSAKYPVKRDTSIATNETNPPPFLEPDDKSKFLGVKIASATASITSAEYQPQFSSEFANNQMGFFFFNKYKLAIKLFDAIKIINISITMNPTYALRESADGFIMVNQIGPTYVVLVPNDNDIRDDIIEPALATNLPIQLERTFRDNLTIGLERLAPAFPGIAGGIFLNAISCDADAAFQDQQAGCYANVIGANPTASLLFNHVRSTIQELLTGDGSNPGSYATGEATKFVNAIQPRNFSCQRQEQGDFCGFRPTIHRVNVLPNELELVVAGDLDSGGQQAENEQALYFWLPLLAADAGAELPAEFSNLCEGPSRPVRGTLSRLQLANEKLPEPSSCASCYGDNPVCDKF